MNKRQVCIPLILAMTAVIALTSCGTKDGNNQGGESTSSSTTTTTASETTTTAGEPSTGDNDVSYTYAPPEGWTASAETGMDLFFSPDLQSNINVIAVEAPDKTIESMTQDQFQAAMELMYSDIDVLSFQSVEINGMKGLRVEYTATISSLSVHPIQYLLTSDKASYTITLTTPDLTATVSLFEESMQTFREAA